MTKNRNTFIVIGAVLWLCCVLIVACKKEQPTPANPYDNIDRTNSTSGSPSSDSLTITYLHKKVLSPRCNINGCHDGHFEPDFRTPQSAFSTLVYAPIVKNDNGQHYKYRVIPFDTLNSVFYLRVTKCCFVNNNDRMPQDNIGVPLPDSSINFIRQWILNGARDMFGNVARLPNNPPVILPGYGMASTDYQTNYNNRLDSVNYNPVLIPSSVSSFYVVLTVTDDSTPVNQLQYNRLKISTDADNFSAATAVNAFYFESGQYKVWVAPVSTAALPANDTLFMRYYVNDGDHTQNTEFPRNESPIYYKLYFSFIKQQ